MGSCKGDKRKQIPKKNILVHGAVIIGGGPSGLAVSACLKENGVPSLILERSDCIASLWQQRTYDRLKLHLPRQFCELPFLGFPGNFPKYPTKRQFISYLESYAKHFSIELIFKKVVHGAAFDEFSGLWKVQTQDFEYFSRWLIAATGENAEPLIPEIQGIGKFEGHVVHTSVYKSMLNFEKQRVLVLGCGNSGMEVCLDLCRHNAFPHMVVRSSVHILPREMFGVSTISMAMTLSKWFPLRVVDKFLVLVAYLISGNTDSLGIKRPKTGPIELKNVTGKTPVLDVGALSQIRSGNIKVMEGVREITRKGAKLMDGQEKDFDSIILATRYKSNFVPTWLKDCDDLFWEDGTPKRGFPESWRGEKGLFTVGFSKRGLLGISSDAINIGREIGDQWRKVEMK